jgi:hypothetical protein
MVFWAIKEGKIRFPNVEISEPYTRDLLALYEHMSEPVSGISHKLFRRDPAKPDDFCHALTFASLVAMRLAGHSMLNLVPGNVVPAETHGFPVESNINIDDVLQSINSV